MKRFDVRNFARKRVDAKICGAISKIEGFTLLDISQSGALIKTAENLKMGHNYCINFDMPEGDPIYMKVKVVRCSLVEVQQDEKEKRSPSYEIGLEFLEPDKKQLERLSLFISKEEHIITTR
jgi:c-di-GMP-binding flagellar brake protein YcgR